MKMKQMMAAALVALLSVFGASAADPTSDLQGKASGVQIMSDGGVPGAEMQIRIRGAVPVLELGYAIRIFGNYAPMYMVMVGASQQEQASSSAPSPAVVVYINDELADAALLNTVNPADIESMEILRDAAAKAFYSEADIVVKLEVAKYASDLDRKATIRGLSSLGGSDSPLYVVDGIQVSRLAVADLAQGEILAMDVLKDASAGAIYGSRAAHGVIMITTKIAVKDPLYVLDGIPCSATTQVNVNPDDIESMTILKDAAATALYGSRAAGGVVLITTNRGFGNIGPLLIVDGLQVSSGALSTISPDDIASLEILKDASAGAIYGSAGANGVVIITTRFGNGIQGGEVTMPKGADGSTGLLKAPGSATWKAKPYQGYVFAGWKWNGDATNCPAAFNALSVNELKNPALKLKLVEGDEVRPTSIEAIWALISNDTFDKVELTPSNLVVECASYVTATVKGLPSGLKFDKKTLAITGTTTKTNDFNVVVTLKNASGYTFSQTFKMTFAADKDPTVEPAGDRQTAGFPVLVWGDTNGTAKTSKVYLPTYDAKKGTPKTKASLSAKPNKGYVFAGWYKDAEYKFSAWFNDPAWKGYRVASQSIPLTTNLVANGQLELFAKFITKAVYDKQAGTWSGDDVVTDFEFYGWGGKVQPGTTNLWYQGVQVPAKMSFSFKSQTAYSVSVSGIPAGVKYDKNQGCFTGAPTKAGLFTVTVSVKNASGAQKFVQMVEVKELPVWAIGTFDGYHVVETNTTLGTFSATIAKTGKVSGKTAGGAADTKFSAPYFSEVYSEDGTNLIYVLDTTVKYKVGKTTVTTNNTLYVMENQATGLGQIGGGDEDGCGVVAMQNGWKLKPVELPNFAKNINTLAVTNASTNVVLTLKFGAKGVVTVAGTAGGKKVSTKAQVLPVKWQSINGVEILRAEVCVYIAAKGDFVGFCEVYDVLLTENDNDEFGAVTLAPPTFSTYLMEGSDRRYMLADLSAEGQMLIGQVKHIELPFPIVKSSQYMSPVIFIAIIIFYTDEYGMTQQTMASVDEDGTFKVTLAEGGTLIGLKIVQERAEEL